MKHGVMTVTLLVVGVALATAVPLSGTLIREGANPRLPLVLVNEALGGKFVQPPGVPYESPPKRNPLVPGWPLWPQRPWICL